MDCISMALILFFSSKVLALNRWRLAPDGRGQQYEVPCLTIWSYQGFIVSPKDKTAAGFYPVSRLIGGQAERAPE